ncbi:barstar family protein [Thorsellia anophelis]|uniref:Barstar (Barnase inhibitor) n=1 Tax=Thorsellia anophelis DSM 18579 TaxID=1123402 RepID=A0A1H9Y9S2_9GAMM|nr:barstar family protein [Thorsellia anophelis]SES65697.1 Barstar (barnase inhibitor) [Thorsellia anophelis DSM 18579]
MKLTELTLDFSTIKTYDDLHQKLTDLFGFPDFYGKNYPALIDCLTSLRHPEDGMTTIHVSHDEAILLQISDMTFDKATIGISGFLLAAIQFVNYRCMLADEKSLIYLFLDRTF